MWAYCADHSAALNVVMFSLDDIFLQCGLSYSLAFLNGHLEAVCVMIMDFVWYFFLSVLRALCFGFCEPGGVFAVDGRGLPWMAAASASHTPAARLIISAR